MFEYIKRTMYQPPFRAAGFLILRHTVPKNLVMSHGIVIFSAAIAGIALHGVNDTVLNFLNDTNMVGFSVLRAG